MLSKKVCKHCISVEPYVNGHTPRDPEDRVWAKEHGWRFDSLGQKMLTNLPEGWNENYDKLWDEGIVFCPMIHGGEKPLVDAPPPSFCPYSLEHVVLLKG